MFARALKLVMASFVFSYGGNESLAAPLQRSRGCNPSSELLDVKVGDARNKGIEGRFVCPHIRFFEGEKWVYAYNDNEESNGILNQCDASAYIEKFTDKVRERGISISKLLKKRELWSEDLLGMLQMYQEAVKGYLILVEEMRGLCVSVSDIYTDYNNHLSAFSYMTSSGEPGYSRFSRGEDGDEQDAFHCYINLMGNFEKATSDFKKLATSILNVIDDHYVCGANNGFDIGGKFCNSRINFKKELAVGLNDFEPNNVVDFCHEATKSLEEVVLPNLGIVIGEARGCTNAQTERIEL